MYSKIKYGPNPLDYRIIEEGLDYSKTKESREAVRGIVIKDDTILVLYPKQDVIYGLPGGGIEIGETKEEALKREMKEEIGALDITIIKYLGCVLEERNSTISDALFCPKMHYYWIEIKEQGNPDLEAYEQALELESSFVNINEIVKHNRHYLNKRPHSFSGFYWIQTIVFELLQDII
jgi:ADP-ribose pyrophosphatase YjhB (NUDIX family)